MRLRKKFFKPSLEGGVFIMPWENAFNKIVSPIEAFIRSQTTSAFLLMCTTLIALILANTNLSELYLEVRNTYASIQIGDWGLKKTIHHWVNDGLMAFFFFLVGLELKREILVGELAELDKALLPIGAAIGGMVFPALIYYSINSSGTEVRGWAIPMATDIAFAIGVLSLLSKRVPKALATFLVALAIVDDIGAVIVIAVFYTATINFGALLVVAFIVLLLLGLNISGIRAITPYFILAIFLWYALSLSGVHATLAGILGAFTVPSLPKYEPDRFIEHVDKLMKKFNESYQRNKDILKNEELNEIVIALESGTERVETMLQRLEHIWELPVSYLIIPIFALVNAGIPLKEGAFFDALNHPVAVGISLGLLLGKILGITGVCWLMLKLGIGKLPEKIRITHIFGMSMLAAIGFTMSIFITELGFGSNENLLNTAKTGIFLASFLGGVCGFVWLYLMGNGENNKGMAV